MKQRKKDIKGCKTSNSRSKGVTEENDQDIYFLLNDEDTIKYKYKYEYVKNSGYLQNLEQQVKGGYGGK